MRRLGKIYKVGGNIGLHKGYFTHKRYEFKNPKIEYTDFVRDENGKLKLERSM